MKIPSTVLHGLLKATGPGLIKILLPLAIIQRRAAAHAERERLVDRQVQITGRKREEVLGNTVLPRSVDFEEEAKMMIDIAVIGRLQGAIVCYEAGNQLECLRYSLLALTHVCVLLELTDASRYLELKTAELLDLERRRVPA